MWFSCFRVLPSSAEAQVIWGDVVKRLLIAYFMSNLSAKNYQNPFTCVKVIASQMQDVFWDTVYNLRSVGVGGTRCDCIRVSNAWSVGVIHLSFLPALVRGHRKTRAVTMQCTTDSDGPGKDRLENDGLYIVGRRESFRVFCTLALFVVRRQNADRHVRRLLLPATECYF